MKTTKEILIETKAYIRKVGRGRGLMEAPDGKVCLLGGLRKVVFGTTSPVSLEDPTYIAARNALDAASGGWAMGFNDKTESDALVFAVLDKAIARAE